MQKHKVSKKINGKWMNVGNLGINKFGNPELGLRISDLQPLIDQAVSEGKGWINLSLFPDLDEPKPVARTVTADDDQGIPF